MCLEQGGLADTRRHFLSPVELGDDLATDMPRNVRFRAYTSLTRKQNVDSVPPRHGVAVHHRTCDGLLAELVSESVWRGSPGLA